MRRVPKTLYPFEGSYFSCAGRRMHYLDEGQGRPIVMVHGNPSWSFYYRNLVTQLRMSYRTIVPDHIGCGLSDKPGDDRYDYSFKQRVEDFTALMDHLELDLIDLVVHDWGGMIAMAWAVEHPERVRSLVLLNTAAFHLPAKKPLPWQLWLVRNTPLGSVLVRGFNAFARGAVRTGVTRQPMSREVGDAYCAPYDSWSDRIATLRFVEDIPLKEGDRGFDLVSRTEERLSVFTDRPVLICWGAKDFVFDDHFLAEWQRIYPQADVHRFADCGHYILEDASTEVIGLIRDFLVRQASKP